MSDIVFAVDMIVVNGVADEIEASDTKTFFVDSVIIKWVIIIDISDADDSVMGIDWVDFAELKREVAGRDHSFFAVRKLVIEIASEISVFGFVSGGCAHGECSFLVL